MTLGEAALVWLAFVVTFDVALSLFEIYEDRKGDIGDCDARGRAARAGPAGAHRRAPPRGLD